LPNLRGGSTNKAAARAGSQRVITNVSSIVHQGVTVYPEVFVYYHKRVRIWLEIG
jgi:hypothetical protein